MLWRKRKNYLWGYKISCKDSSECCLGYIEYDIRHIAHKTTAHIEKLFVFSSHRKKGIRAELLKQAVQDMRNKVGAHVDITLRAQPINNSTLTEEDLIAYYQKRCAVRMHAQSNLMKFSSINNEDKKINLL